MVSLREQNHDGCQGPESQLPGVDGVRQEAPRTLQGSWLCLYLS